jgi:hypothetical protein
LSFLPNRSSFATLDSISPAHPVRFGTGLSIVQARPGRFGCSLFCACTVRRRQLRRHAQTMHTHILFGVAQLCPTYRHSCLLCTLRKHR